MMGLHNFFKDLHACSRLPSYIFWCSMTFVYGLMFYKAEKFNTAWFHLWRTLDRQLKSVWLPHR